MRSRSGRSRGDATESCLAGLRFDCDCPTRPHSWYRSRPLCQFPTPSCPGLPCRFNSGYRLASISLRQAPRSSFSDPRSGRAFRSIGSQQRAWIRLLPTRESAATLRMVFADYLSPVNARGCALPLLAPSGATDRMTEAIVYRRRGYGSIRIYTELCTRSDLRRNTEKRARKSWGRIKRACCCRSSVRPDVATR